MALKNCRNDQPLQQEVFAQPVCLLLEQGSRTGALTMVELASARYLFPQVWFSAELLVAGEGEGEAAEAEVCQKVFQDDVVVGVAPKSLSLFRSELGVGYCLLEGEAPSLVVELVLVILPSSL